MYAEMMVGFRGRRTQSRMGDAEAILGRIGCRLSAYQRSSRR
jgi:hypothetical protein